MRPSISRRHLRLRPAICMWIRRTGDHFHSEGDKKSRQPKASVSGKFGWRIGVFEFLVVNNLTSSREKSEPHFRGGVADHSGRDIRRFGNKLSKREENHHLFADCLDPLLNALYCGDWLLLRIRTTLRIRREWPSDEEPPEIAVETRIGIRDWHSTDRRAGNCQSLTTFSAANVLFRFLFLRCFFSPKLGSAGRL